MRRFFRLTIVGCALLMLLCGGALIVGRVQPAPEVIPGLTQCDGLPCYRGIVLNKTTIKDALATLTQLPGAALGLDSRTILLPDGPIPKIILFTGSIGVQTDSDIVREIDLEIRPDAVEVGSLIAYAGTPCNIHIYPLSNLSNGYPNAIVVGYSVMYFWLNTNDWVFYPQMPVTQINLIPHILLNNIGSGALMPSCQPDQLAPTIRWKGFSLSAASRYDTR